MVSAISFNRFDTKYYAGGGLTSREEAWFEVEIRGNRVMIQLFHDRHLLLVYPRVMLHRVSIHCRNRLDVRHRHSRSFFTREDPNVLRHRHRHRGQILHQLLTPLREVESRTHYLGSALFTKVVLYLFDVHYADSLISRPEAPSSPTAL